MLAMHLGPTEIALELDLSERTVRGYLTEGIKVLGAKNLRGAARIFFLSSNTAPAFFTGTIDGVADVAQPEPWVDAAVVTVEPTPSLDGQLNASPLNPLNYLAGANSLGFKNVE